MKRSSTLLLALVFLGLSLSCDNEQEASLPSEVLSANKNCTQKLAAGQYAEAIIESGRVLKNTNLAAIQDNAIDQIRFCYTTAATLKDVNDLSLTLKALFDAAGQILNGALAPSESGWNLQSVLQNKRVETQAASLIGTALGTFINPVRSRLEENRTILEQIRKNPKFRYTLPMLPVKVTDQEIMDAGGVYDAATIDLLYGMTRAILSTFYMIESQDYGFNTSDVLNYALLSVDGHPISTFSDRPLNAVFNLAAVLLGTSPRFLSLDTEKGKKSMVDAGAGFGEGVSSLLSAVAKMKKRTGDQSQHMIEYKVKADGQDDAIIVHMKFKNLGIPGIDAKKLENLQIPLRKDILSGLEHIRDNLKQVAGVRVNLQDDVFPIVALGATVLLGSGAFDALIHAALGGSDPKLAEQIQAGIGLITKNRDYLLGILVSLVPVIIELDLGYIFANPKGLREVMPAWIQPEKLAGAEGKDALKPFTTATLVYEFECRDGSNPLAMRPKEAYLCTEVTDTAHFAAAVTNNVTMNNYGPLWEGRIEPDGIRAKTPYIGFKDPSFGGLLYLDWTQIANETLLPPEPGAPMAKATQRTLNATIASIVATVQGLLAPPATGMPHAVHP